MTDAALVNALYAENNALRAELERMQRELLIRDSMLEAMSEEFAELRRWCAIIAELAAATEVEDTPAEVDGEDTPAAATSD